jgi:hypothetical protein
MAAMTARLRISSTSKSFMNVKLRQPYGDDCPVLNVGI